MKHYCNVCDKVDWYDHSREHLNWKEFATSEEIERADERLIGYWIILKQRVERIHK